MAFIALAICVLDLKYKTQARRLSDQALSGKTLIIAADWYRSTVGKDSNGLEDASSPVIESEASFDLLEVCVASVVTALLWPYEEIASKTRSQGRV